MPKRRFDHPASGVSQRQLRVGELIRHTLAEIFQRGDVHDRLDVGEGRGEFLELGGDVHDDPDYAGGSALLFAARASLPSSCATSRFGATWR